MPSASCACGRGSPPPLTARRSAPARIRWAARPGREPGPSRVSTSVSQAKATGTRPSFSRPEARTSGRNGRSTGRRTTSAGTPSGPGRPMPPAIRNRKSRPGTASATETTPSRSYTSTCGDAAMSHHISGPRAVAEPIADITDLYAFPSPERQGCLVLVLNTLPFAPPIARFSDALIYRFRLRKLTVNGGGAQAPFSPADDEFVIDCVFSTTDPADGGEQHCTCTLPGGDTVTVQVNDIPRSAVRGTRLFAGPRWDPFILDAPAMLKTIATGKLAFTDPGSIYLDGKNVLGLVVEIDCAAVLGDRWFVGVAAETLTRGQLNVRLESAGRPEVPNMMLGPMQFDRVNRDLEIRDLYNMDDAFHPAHVYEGAYRARLNANLAFWDGLD